METAKKRARRWIPYFAVIFMVLWQWLGWQCTAWAAGRDFSAESIQKAGIRDPAFAEAIFENISAHIADGSYQVSAGESTEKILLEYGTHTPQAEILARGREIQDISGIWLLRNATRIDLSDNRIQNLNPLQRDASIEAQKNYFAATEIVLTGNPIHLIPEQMLGFTAGSYRLDSKITVAIPLSYQNGLAERQLLLRYFEQPGGRPAEKVVVFQNREEAERLRSVEQAYPLPFSMTAHYWKSKDEEAGLPVQWSMPLDICFMREFQDVLYEKTLGNIELIAETEDGERIPSISYRLLKANAGGAVSNSDDSPEYVTDAQGTIRIANLPAGSYWLEQQNNKPGYEPFQRRFHIVIQDACTGAGVLGKEAHCSGLPQTFALTANVKNVLFLNRGALQGIETEPDVSTVQQVKALRGDGFLSDHGYVELLKGELPCKAGYELLSGSSVSLYEDEMLLGKYSHPTEAKQVLNRKVREGSLQRDSQSIRMVEELFYDGGCQRIHASFVRPRATGICRIVVQKSWRGVATPSEAYFRPVLRRKGEVVAVLGEVKAVNAGNGWEVSWSLQATPSNAGRRYMQRASAADAERETEFWEDAELFNDSGNMDGQIGVEEVDIPVGWIPQYQAMQRIGDSACFAVTNCQAQPAGIDRPFSRGQDTPAVKGRERATEVIRQTARLTEGSTEQREEVKQQEIKRKEVKTEEVKAEEAKQKEQRTEEASDPIRETEQRGQAQIMQIETAAPASLPWAKIRSCKVKKFLGRVPGRQLVLSGKGEWERRGSARRLPHTREILSQQEIWFRLTILWLLAMLFCVLHMGEKQH